MKQHKGFLIKPLLLICLVIALGSKSQATHLQGRYIVQDSLPDQISILLIHRYGSTSRKLEKAWKILLAAGYSFQTVSFIDTEKMTLLNAVFSSDKGLAMQTSDQQRILLPALDLFYSCIPEFKANKGFVADLNSLTTECLNRYLNQLALKCAHSLAEKDKNGYKKWGQKFLKTAFDFNDLLKYMPEISSNFWVLKIPLQLKQWTLLINYGQECLLRHKKFNPELIAQQPLNTFALPGVKRPNYSVDLAGSLVLSQSLYKQYIDTDIGFE